MLLKSWGKTISVLLLLLQLQESRRIRCPQEYVFIPVEYSVDFQSECPPANGTSPPSFPVTVAVPAGSTALDVMEGAVDISRDFQFSATNFGATLGFLIDKISGTASRPEDNCFWSFLVTSKKGDDPQPSSVGVSHFSICDEISITFQLRFFGSHN